jgi:hypothetical protein
LFQAVSALQMAPFQKIQVIHLLDQPGPVEAIELENFGYCTTLEELRIVFAGDGTEPLLTGGFPMLWTTLVVSAQSHVD